MKTKPTRHKDTNTFKFKPFSERVNEIDVDVFHKVAHRNELDSEAIESYFYQRIHKWNFMNLSENYTQFRKEVKGIITLPQLLHKKQHVIDTLLKYLKLKDPLCLHTIFDLVIAVAKDLQIDFYPYFPDFLEAIIDLLQTKDAEQLEHTFTTLAYLMKFQWRFLIRNVDKIFHLLVPLLADTRPDYINNFAAESFAFVVRKVKDKESFLRTVLGALSEKQDGVVGCGKLLFYVLAGVSGQFHSCADSMLTLYLEALEDPLIDQQLLFSVLSNVFICITKEIHPQKSGPLWAVVLKVMDKFSENSLVRLMQLIQIIISYKDGQMVRDPVSWAKKLTQLIDKYQKHEQLQKEAADVCAATLLASNIKLLQETSSFLVLKLLSIENQDLLLNVTEKLIPYSSFETLVLPQLLKKSFFISMDENSLDFLVKIVGSKSPPSLGGVTLNKWIKYGLNVRGEDNVKILSDMLDSLKDGPVMENALKVLLIFPHMTSLQAQIRPKMKETLGILFKRLSAQEDHQHILNFAFLLAVEAFAHTTSPDEFYATVNELPDLVLQLLSLIGPEDNDASILNALDLIFTFTKESSHVDEYINQTVFDEFHKVLAPKLGSANAQIRLSSSHLISLFCELPFLSCHVDPKEPKPRHHALELPYLAEIEPVTVHNYRNRLQHLQALDYRGACISQLDPDCHDLPLHYLLGQLYVNFSLLWEHVCKLIAGYANRDCTTLWPVFLSKLDKEEKEVVIEAGKSIDFGSEVLREIAMRVCGMSDKVDRENYRLLLWKCMGMMTNYCEVKNRDYVGLFIDFVESNFFKANSEDAKTCNIKKRELPSESIVELDESIADNSLIEALDKSREEVQEEVDEKLSEKPIEKSTEKMDEEEVPTPDEESSPQQMGRAQRVKLLLAMLQVFGKFTNTRSLFREPEVLRIYLDLLSSKNSEIQKAALNCLYTYKHKYLLPYREHLDNITDEKNLKNELARFQVNTASDGGEATVRDEHRSGLMPVLMRILHAKMTQRVGMRTGGKAGGLVRRKTILRFLAGITEDEMMLFVRMAFKPFRNHLPILAVEEGVDHEVDLRQMVLDILQSVDLESVVPPKRLQSAVNLLAVMIEQFGGKMTQKLLPHLFAILACILAQVASILARSDQVHTGFLTSLRNVRNSCLNVLARFFGHFENYDWTPAEIDALFEVAVFPWINKLPTEAIHSPTPLLKMLASWSHNPRYYPFFVKLDKNQETSIAYVIKLLLGSKTHRSVQQVILEMIEKMLTLQDFEKDNPERMDVDEDKPKSLLPSVINKLELVTSDSINYGSSILLPHVTNILVYIERRLKNSKRGATRNELVILSRVSEFVSDPKTCDTLLHLVLPILQRKSNGSEEMVMQLLTTVQNLIKHVEHPEKHLRPIQHLLAQISAAPARRMLMELLDSVVKHDEGMKKNQVVLAELNAYDQRWIDQPDFQRRLDAFGKIDALVKDDQVTLEFGVAIILNCFYFLKTENDLALRDRSGQCLKSLGVHLARKFKDSSIDRKYLIEETILTMVRHGIRNKNENVNLQSIAFLGHMAMECPEVHPVLRDLNALTNKQDPEVDFFENMQHLQLHRKARALLKFCSVAKTLTKAPNPRTLTQFILPLASSYLCTEKYAGKNSIVDAAIETVGVVCRLLPWNQYEIVLRHYLDKLRSCVEFQKQVIRIVVAILDSFHYDLSKYKPETEAVSKPGEKTSKAIDVQPETAVTTEEAADVEASKPSDETEQIEETVEVTEELLDEALNDEAVTEAATEEVEETDKGVSALEKHTVLSQYMARRLVFSISKGLLPQLHNSISVRTRHEGSHKANKKMIKSDQEEEELMRVPIALAMVKLLQKLPQGLLDSNLRGIFMKICTFLKSRLESVRRTTREILQKIMVALGPDYLHHLLKEMNALLTRGYQVHVLVFTLHAVLVTLKPYFKPEHMRKNLSTILSMCKIDLFGPSADEKEIAGIVNKVSEAKSTKSFDVFHILGESIDEGLLIDVVIPLKDVLSRTRSHKTVRKVTESLRQFGLGLADNSFIQIKEMLTFLYGVSSESIPQLMPENKKKKAEEEEKKKIEAQRQKPDCFIIMPPPKNKMGIKAFAKTSKDTNAYVMVEFSLRLFHILLKRDKVNDVELKSTLDPFVPTLSDCLKSQHVKLSTSALQCLSWILKRDLPTVQSSVSEICSSIFNILHKYAVAGLSKGDNYDLVMAGFKAMSVLVRDVKHFVISNDQLKALLVYAEQDLHDSDKQATAFGLLKAIIKRKLIVPEMHDVMQEVATLSVLSELDNVRKQARTVFYAYLMDYPLGKKLDSYISFYTTQLSYELQPGRLSVLEMLYAIITGFPLDAFLNYSDLLFLTIGARLVNDDDPICKKASAKCIQEIIERSPHNNRTKLFEIVTVWLKDKKLVHRRLAVQLCGIYVAVEEDKFRSKLEEVLPLLTKQFYATDSFDSSEQPGRFVKVQKEDTLEMSEGNIKDPQRLNDHHLFQVLQLLVKISTHCSAFLKDKTYQDHVNTFAEHSQSLLAHPHLWVRLASAQLLGLILEALDVEKVIHLLDHPEDCDLNDGFIYSDPSGKLKSLILDSTAQLQPDSDFGDLYKQIIENLVIIARLLKVPQFEQENESKESADKGNLSLLWVLKKLRRCINFEVSTAPKSTIVRASVFEWMKGVIRSVDIEKLRPILFYFLSALTREMASIEESNASLRQQAKEIATTIKKKIGVEDYARLLSKAQQRLDTRRAERKQVRSQQFVTDPELAAKRKIAKQQKKKVARKRKIDNMKGKKVVRKKPRKEVDLEVV
ncbi:hypothetical protein QAD02_009142 [Eretmocerus hayati]|uniref:Uncharacterized protein n=1 Tax=Eretmocerus hayati TaxID=131215 RepID=A0ACC2N8D3_9HYME|nr:hypothetical protein QAD02_009142 [Eretmocerus hayati]